LAVFEERFGRLYHPDFGRPGMPIRLMVGLSYLQHTFALSDEAVVVHALMCGAGHNLRLILRHLARLLRVLLCLLPALTPQRHPALEPA
jgi:hypothetical protein